MTRRADITDYLLLFYVLTNRYDDIVCMTVKCPLSIGMLNNAVSAVSAAAAARVVLAVIVSTVVLNSYDCTFLSRTDLCIVYLAVIDINTLVVAVKGTGVTPAKSKGDIIVTGYRPCQIGLRVCVAVSRILARRGCRWRVERIRRCHHHPMRCC